MGDMLALHQPGDKVTHDDHGPGIFESAREMSKEEQVKFGLPRWTGKYKTAKGSHFVGLGALRKDTA
jgi:hypothetical protein